MKQGDGADVYSFEEGAHDPLGRVVGVWLEQSQASFTGRGSFLRKCFSEEKSEACARLARAWGTVSRTLKWRWA